MSIAVVVHGRPKVGSGALGLLDARLGLLHDALGCVPGGGAPTHLCRMSIGGRPWSARRLIRRIWARIMALTARVWTTSRFSSVRFGREADFRGPNTVFRIAPGPLKLASWPNAESEKSMWSESEPRAVFFGPRPD